MRKSFLLPVILAFGCQTAAELPVAGRGRSMPSEVVDGDEITLPVKCEGEECICTYSITIDDDGKFNLGEPRECKWPESIPDDKASSCVECDGQ